MKNTQPAVCDPVDPPDGATWGLIRDKLEADLERAEGITPVELVEDYHFSALAAIKATLQAIIEKDQDDIANAFELTDNEEVMLKASVLAEIKSELDADTFDTLKAAGCNVD